MTAQPSLPDVDEIQTLYDESRFLDAYVATRELWQHPELVPRLDVDRLILAGRLAGRLGSHKVQRWLLRRAVEVAPDHPWVRYLARPAARLSLSAAACPGFPALSRWQTRE